MVSRAGTGTRSSFRSADSRPVTRYTNECGSCWIPGRAPDRSLGRSSGRQNQLRVMTEGLEQKHKAALGSTVGTEVYRLASRGTDRRASCQVPGNAGPWLRGAGAR